jgi:hypothetical protein
VLWLWRNERVGAGHLGGTSGGIAIQLSGLLRVMCRLRTVVVDLVVEEGSQSKCTEYKKKKLEAVIIFPKTRRKNQIITNKKEKLSVVAFGRIFE